MKALQLTCLFLLFAIGSHSQETSSVNPARRNTIYAEAFGQGFFGSLNYERLISPDSKVMSSFSAGIIFAPKSAGFGDGMYLGTPLSYNWIFGKKNHHLELGVGFTLVATEEFSRSRFENFYTYLTPKVGYRYQRPGGGLFFRATASPMVALVNVSAYGAGSPVYRTFFKDVAGNGYSAFPWPGLSIGYTF